ncbi:YidH family protein [Bordetella genomosp. 1]|uniref:DUF202 domain-containing protein n=1 Tax=Bordetella genomosp. 1 TaxID=1395607 RepID=A0ABX4F4C6_9BORD|nr:DUF202 domain-containing protein [Bordetella genomosp. 1]OZI68608.1 hypothetical protein CAL27_03850 [Bordetella genomosp. 1]
MKKPQWQCEGEDPDYRFTLANERTYLAWIRTALALLASGIVLDHLTRIHPAPRSAVSAIGLVSLAAFCTVIAYLRWRANEIAMRNKRALPHNPPLAILCIILAALSVFVGLRILD